MSDTATREDRGYAPGSTRLTGPGSLTDAPLTVEDWRIIWHAYYGFITVVRKVAADAWKRHDQEASQQPRGVGTRGDGGA